MKYAKYIPELNRRESWEETVSRNKEMHIKKFPFLKEEIEEVYKLVYDKKVLPSMRSFQFAGKPIETNPARMYNCAFCPIDDWHSFGEIMFLLLSGCGVGFSVQHHHIDKLPYIKRPIERKRRYLIGDSIEGWSDAIKALMKSYFFGTSTIVFDYSDIRKKGERLVTSGGKAPGPQPLHDCLHNIKKILEQKKDGERLSSLEVHDIVCFIADAVLAGGIRRAALLSLFSFDDEDMISCKYGDWYIHNPQRGRANNSANVLRSQIKKNEFYEFWEKIKHSRSGEPGIYFSNNEEMGINPCNEKALLKNQFCNLTTINVSDILTQEEFENRVRAATFIGTLQASYTDFHYLRDIWKKHTEKEYLLGVSMTGICNENFLKLDIEKGSELVLKVNKEVSEKIGIGLSARSCCIKPEGTSSLVLGTSSGVHSWHSKYYIRRIRVGKNEAIYDYLKNNHPELIEDDYFKPHLQAVISIPVKAPEGAITRDSENFDDILNRVARLHKDWVQPGHRKGHNTDNVSVTVSVKDDEWNDIGDWLWNNKNYFNGMSVLPWDGGTYIQAPLEECSEEDYENMILKLKDVDLKKVIELEDNTDLQGEIACGGGACML